MMLGEIDVLDFIDELRAAGQRQVKSAAKAHDGSLMRERHLIVAEVLNALSLAITTSAMRTNLQPDAK